MHLKKRRRKAKKESLSLLSTCNEKVRLIFYKASFQADIFSC